MATSQLRPLSVGEILDAGVKVVTRNWKPLLGSLLLVSTPVWVLFVLLIASFDDTAFRFTPGEDPFSSSTSTADPSASFIVGLLLTMIVLMVAFLVSFVAVFKGVCDAWLGARPSIGRSLRFGLRRSGWVLLLTLIWTPCITLFMLPCGIPALWLGTMWSLSIPAMLFERVGPFKALGRSYGLIQGRFWESLLVVLVVVGVYYVVSNILSLGIMGLVAVASNDNGIANAVAQGVGSVISTAIAVPYISALLTILYFDMRVRKEGLDIQFLAQGLGIERDPDAPIPAPLQPPSGWVTPPPGWQSPTGWVGPQASQPGPLRWGPAAPPPAPGGWGPPSDPSSPWTPPTQGGPSWAPPPDERPSGDTSTGPSPWMTPGPPAAGDARDTGTAPAADDTPTSPLPDSPLADDSRAGAAPTAPRHGSPASDDAPTAPLPDSPAADDPPAWPPRDTGDSPWMTPPAEEERWKPRRWEPTEWKPRDREDEDKS